MTRLWPMTFISMLTGGGIWLAAQDAKAPAIDIDHVILGINDLERGIQQFAQLTGVTPTRGGEHPGRGTQNALVSLGGGRYLEVLAPAGSNAAAPRDLPIHSAELTPAGWALQTRAIADVVAQLRAAGLTAEGPVPGSRRTPDGALLEWQVASARGPGLELAPFFIEWSKGSTHPSAGSPAGCTLVRMELAHPEPERLRSFFAAVAFPVTIATAERPGMRLTLDCPRGRIDFAR